MLLMGLKIIFSKCDNRFMGLLFFGGILGIPPVNYDLVDFILGGFQGVFC